MHDNEFMFGAEFDELRPNALQQTIGVGFAFVFYNWERTALSSVALPSAPV
jgi:hypothetical protein